MNERIAETQFVVIGLGALGSEVVHLLAREGARRFMLLDGDLMLPGNVARHRAGLEQAGLSKVEVAERIIRTVRPDAEVHAEHGWWDEIAPSLALNDEGDVLVLGLTGDEGVEHFIADGAKALRTPCLHAWTELEGRVLRLCRFLPGTDPTLTEVHCSGLAPALPRSEAEEPHPTTCAEVVIPGAAVNLHAAANFVARYALDIAAGVRGEENHWLVTPCGVDLDGIPPALKTAYGIWSAKIPRP